MSTVNYINEKGQSILFDIIIAAYHFHVQGLIDITTMEVARKMENKTPPIGVEEWSVRNIRSDCKAVKEEFIAHIKEDVHGESRDTNKWSISDKWFDVWLIRCLIRLKLCALYGCSKLALEWAWNSNQIQPDAAISLLDSITIVTFDQ